MTKNMEKAKKVRYFEYGDVLLKKVKGGDCDGCYFYNFWRTTPCHVCSHDPLNVKYVEADPIEVAEYKLQELQRLRRKHPDFFKGKCNQDMNVTININL